MVQIGWMYPDFIEHRYCEKVKYSIKYDGEQPSYFSQTPTRKARRRLVYAEK